jgi:hypothetical protein
MYGSTFVSGWCGYFLAGKEAPAGKILVFDDSKVYGFGRKPQYYRWTTPIEHQLFAAVKPDASDASGKRNNGKLEGAVSAQGKSGRAMKPTGTAGSVRGFAVTHDWTVDVPMIARAMVLAGGTLFVAGPPDLVDEPAALRRINDPQIQRNLAARNLAAQAAALDGRKGALLMAVSAADGTELARYDIDCPPVFDGMAAAAGRLYMATVNGKVLCFRPDK